MFDRQGQMIVNFHPTAYNTQESLGIPVIDKDGVYVIVAEIYGDNGNIFVKFHSQGIIYGWVHTKYSQYFNIVIKT